VKKRDKALTLVKQALNLVNSKRWLGKPKTISLEGMYGEQACRSSQLKHRRRTRTRRWPWNGWSMAKDATLGSRENWSPTVIKRSGSVMGP
jgi:hypothetical protein